MCVSYSSVTVVKHHNQNTMTKTPQPKVTTEGRVCFGFGSRGRVHSRNARKLRVHILSHKSEAESNLDVCEAFYSESPSPASHLSSKAVPSTPSQERHPCQVRTKRSIFLEHIPHLNHQAMNMEIKSQSSQSCLLTSTYAP